MKVMTHLANRFPLLIIKFLVTWALLLGCSASSFANTSDGIKTALLLNERYNRTDENCNGNPAYYCSGIVVRVNEQPGKIDTWTPYIRDSDNFLQFSYIRKDIGVNLWAKTFGIILKAREDDEYSTRCFFPVNAMSGERLNNGCGEPMSIKKARNEDVDNSTCKEQGVNTAEEWVAKYKELPPPINSEKACSFSSHNASTFNAALKASLLLGERGNNELIVNTSPTFWSATDPSKDHIQALWYYKDSEWLDSARLEQQKYFDTTGLWVPVISIDPTNDNVFSYSEADQKVKPSSRK
ncbi:hypothetical protein F3I27_20535 [Pantoea sp. Bo_2]|uniref:Uncharacterized protein n=1 Tax=Candidatus Pantoea gossypiicola TaxID=2608008 RepID=A0AB34CDF4_9GAMM|nr:MULTISPECIES: hypothetical protein [Pantoea]KAA5920947.1 hypothetical protein F3I59_23305 [Pantoea sp. VH_8]KAA5928482.1 hypothetical protein F3I58_22150 [Pantoea sp. VH_4]KAA5936411.1 hypothetical protein F3I57_22850 [Pantoea sp. VH_3]KAA5948121.1 hypothetical protein F3I56_20745 [Pantoea sp. VH_25]KAA5948538.1 hypothetical protein F3I55_23520 [Pantoea sp. VH_24]